jgi:hypothetical protein
MSPAELKVVIVTSRIAILKSYFIRFCTIIIVLLITGWLNSRREECPRARRNRDYAGGF